VIMRRPEPLLYEPAPVARGACKAYVTQGDDDAGTLADDFGVDPLQARRGVTGQWGTAGEGGEPLLGGRRATRVPFKRGRCTSHA
jgi:hypothetical protein